MATEVDLELNEEEDELAMEEEMAEEQPVEEEPQRVKSQVAMVRKQKGRGFEQSGRLETGRVGGTYESLDAGSGPGPAKSVEGWCVFVTNLHEEAAEEDLQDAFAEFGNIKNVYMNLDRRTGFVKGYAIVEYSEQKAAEDAIAEMDGVELLTQQINVSWAFTQGPLKKLHKRR